MAIKDCTFFVDVNGRQVEMDFDGFRAYLMEEAGLARLAPDLFKKRGKKAGFEAARAEAASVRAEATPTKAEAAPVKAEAPSTKKTKETGKTEKQKGFFKVTNTALREIFNVTKEQATGIAQLAKAMGIDLDQIRLARGEIKPITGEGLEQRGVTSDKDAEYVAAVKAGDTAKAQKMVDEAAKAAGYNVLGWHGSPDFKGDVFDPAFFGRATGMSRGGFSFAPNQEAAEAYLSQSVDAQQAVIDAATQAARVLSKEDVDYEWVGPYGESVDSIKFDASVLDEEDIDSFRAYLQELADSMREAYPKATQAFEAAAATSKGKATPRLIKAWLKNPQTVDVEGRTLYLAKNSNQIKSADPVTYDDKGNVIPLSKRFRPETPDIRYQMGEKTTPSKADAEYMAAVKAGDTAKAQKIVDEAAKAAGYNETGSHGLAEGKLESYAFDMARLGRNTKAASAKLGFFFASPDTARAYSNISLDEEAANDVAQQARRILSPLLQSIPKGLSRELDYARDNLETLFSTTSKDEYEPESYVGSVQGEVARYISDAEFYIVDDEEAAITDVQRRQISEAIKQAQKQLEATLSQVPDFSVVKTGAVVNAVLRMQNPFVYDQKGRTYRERTYFDIIQKAKEEGHDSVIIKNTYDGGPLDDIKVVFEPNQIKSAAPVTYDYRGNIIPPSQRFKAETPDIRYQTGYHAARGLFEPEPGFPNGRFRLDKIGTGLGGQAYGWGIYLAPERPGASSYYDALRAESPTAVLYELDVPDDIVGKLLDFGKPIPIKLRVAVNRELKAQGVDLEIDASISLGDAIEQIQDAAFPDSEDYAKLTSELLDRAGIPGLQVSAYGEKRPYVIWNQDALDRVALLKANEKTLGEIGKAPSPLGSIVSIETENGADYWYAPPEETPQGLITFMDREEKRMTNGVLAVIRGFSAANVSTPIHEMFHFYRRFLLNEENGFTAAEIKAFEDWAGAKDGVWSVEADEKAARGFEKYLRTGVAPLESLKKLFARIAEWMRGVYKTLDGSAIDIDITPEARRVYDRIFTLQAERQLRPDTKVSKVQRGSKTLYQTEITPKEGPVYTDNILEAMKKWSPKGTVEQLKAHLGKFKGAIAEANWIGLPVFLEGRDRVTRAEVEQFVKDNEISIQEVLLGEPGAPPESRARFGAYTLEPSGENYRELLLTIKPQSPRLIQTATGRRVYEPGAQRLSPTMDAVAAERELARLLSVPTPTFVHQGHYPTPNIVVHVRFNERTMADGNKVLFLEEIQSDWAQAWRQRRASSTATPFEDTPVWTALAFKRMLRWATDIGFDKIAWTTGRIQARRWHQTVTVPDIPRTGIESIEFTKAQRFLSTDPDAWDLTVRLLDGKEERYQDITTNTLKEEFGTAIANEIVRVARSVPGGMRLGQRRTISLSPSGRQKVAKVRVSMLVREEEVGFWDSDDTWLAPVLVVTETGLDGKVTTIELDPSTTAADYFGNTLYERILTEPGFDDYYEAVLKAREEGRPEPPAPELVLSPEDLASIEAAQQATQQTSEAAQETTRQTSQIANAMMTYYDTIIPKEVKKLVKPFGGTVTTERLESGQTVHTVSVTDKMKAQARQGQVLFQREGEGVPKEQTATEAYRKYQQEQRQKNVQAAFARLRQQATAAKPEETKTKAKPEAAKAQAEPSKAKKAPAAPSGQPRQPRAASTEAKRGFGDKTLTEVFDKLVKDVKAGTIPRQTTPATDTERLEERIQRSLRDIVIAAYGTKVIPEDIAAQAKDLADAMLAAQAKGDTETFDAAEQAFKTLTAGARRASRPQPPPRPAKTVAERLDDAVKRAEKPPVSGVTSPEVFAQEEIGRRARKFQEFIKKAMQQNSAAKPYLDEVTINGQTRSRRDLFLLGAEEYEKGVVENNPLLKQQGDDKMRAAIDSIAATLTDIKRPQWHNLRSPLSYANVIGSYEAIMGPLGKEISDLFKLFHSSVARGELGFGEALRNLEVRLNKAYVPLMIAQGYLGMPSVIKEHVAFIRKTAALSARMTQVKQAGSVFKEPAAWFAARRDLVQDFGYAPLAALMLKSAVYNTKLRFNVKSAATNFFQLALSAGPYLTPDEFVKIINDSLKPSTWKREVAPGMTLRDVAIGETGGRRVEGAPDLSAQSKWWHRIDVFQLSSDHVRVAAYLVGELMAERYSAQQEASGRPALAASTKSRMIRDWVEKVEFDNSPWNRAPLFRGSVADILFQFKPFLQKNVERMIADLQRNPEGFVVRPAKTPVGKLVEVALPQGARRVVKLLAAQVTLGGVSSLLTAVPGLKAMGGILLLAGLINMFKSAGMDDDEAEELAVGLYYGAPAALGIDLSSTVGFFDEPFGKEVYEQVVSYFLGPSVSTGLNVYKRFQEYTKAAQEAPKLGREEAKAKEVQERLLKIPAAVTPYVRMYNAAKDMVTGQPTTIRLQEEVQLSRKEQIIQALGGSPIQQTMFFDNKEAYGWQNRLMGRPTGYERVKPKPGESNDAYFKRAAVAERLTSQYLPELQRNPQFQQMSPADQEAVLDNLSRNITEESGKARPDRRKLRARLLVRNRRQTMREQRRKALRDARVRGITR